MPNRYHYSDHIDLHPATLLTWIVIDNTAAQIGVQDVAAIFAVVAGLPILPTRQKPAGAVKGTSIASSVLRQHLNYRLKYRIPTLVGSPWAVRIRLTRNLGAVVGRAIPGVGWAILAHDVIVIMRKSIHVYNLIVRKEDQLPFFATGG